MSTTLLERTRAAHEDIELYERAIVEALLNDAKSVRPLSFQGSFIIFVFIIANGMFVTALSLPSPVCP